MFKRLVFSLPLNLSAKVRLVGFALLFFSSAALIPAQNTNDAAKVFTLEPGKPLEGELTNIRETHGYRIKLVAGQSAKIVVEQREIDVSEQLYAPDNSLIARFDGEIRLREKDEIEFVAERSGEYRLDVKTKFKSAAGRYEIRLAELRDATERDRFTFESRVLSAKADELAVAGKYAEAAPLIARALEIAEKQLGTDDAYVGQILNRLGYLQRQQGNYAAAEATLQRAFGINQKALGLEHPQTVDSIQYLGLVYRSTNDYGKADKMIRQSLAITEKTLGEDHPRLVQQLISLEALLADMSDSEQAEKALQRALTIAEKHYEPDSLTITNIFNNLGAIYQDRGEYDRAEPYFRQVLAIYEKTIGTENDRYANTLQNLGIALRYRKNYAQALEVYQRALAIREKILGKEHLNTAPLLNNIANVYHSMGDYAKAAETQRRALAIAEKSGGPYHGQAIQSLVNLAKIYSAAGDIANAFAFQTLADERIEPVLALDLAIGSERQKLLQLDSLGEKTSRTISMSVNLASDNPKAATLAALVVLQRKGRVLDAMSDTLAALRGRFNVEDQKLLDDLNSITADLAKITLNKSSKITLDEQQKQIAELTEKKENLEQEISRRSAEFRTQSQPVSLAAVQAEIPQNAALVEFAVYEPYNPKAQNNTEAYAAPRYIAYIIQRTGAIQFEELGDKKMIDAAIDEWRKALRDPKRSDVQTLARAVDASVMQPIRALLGDAKQLLVSPDGALNLIPFEALVDERSRYLIENYSFTYLTSGRDLLRMQTARASKSKSLLIANPQFGETSAEQTIAANRTKTKFRAKRQSVTATRNMTDTYFAPIAATLQEARSIQTLFPDAQFLTGAQATETALKQANAPKILHIATHGFFLEDETSPDDIDKSATRNAKTNVESENPLLRSGLALAGANQRDSVTGDDGILTALEASGLNLWGTKLVVLSACDTGLGEVRNGEGVYGLRRSFVLAGAESLVMSLWSVSDYVTRETMVEYYKNLKQGIGRGAALRQVKLEMLKKKSRAHPFYWAAFIESGEWANLDGKR